MLTRRAYADMPAKHQDTLIGEHFIAVLCKSIKRFFSMKDHEMFSATVRIAKGIKYNYEIVNGKAPRLKANE